jgi:hypothetical protein
MVVAMVAATTLLPILAASGVVLMHAARRHPGEEDEGTREFYEFLGELRLTRT